MLTRLMGGWMGKMEGDLQSSLAFYDKTPCAIIFQQDNDPKHTCKKVQNQFQDYDMEVLLWPVWPEKSSDLNPIEYLWNHLKRKMAVYEAPPQGVLELQERVQEKWGKIRPEVCQGLIESFPRQVEAIIKAKDDYTKY